MNRIWANRLEAGTQIWANCPYSRRNAVKAIMFDDVQEGRISQERYNEILGIEEE